jgi:hypothetical protein
MEVPMFLDAGGTLVAIELDEVPFTVRRLFAVTGPEGGATRGNHRVSCTELIVLVSGTVTIRLGGDADSLDEKILLEAPGAALLVPEGVFLQYHLPDAESSIVVLAERPHKEADPAS